MSLHHLPQVPPGELRDKLTPTTASAASASWSPITTTPPSSGRTSSSSRTRSPRSPRWGPHRRRHGAEVDAIVFGTGFHVTDMPIAERVRRRGRPHPRRGLGGRHAGLPAAPPSAASPTCSCSSGRTPGLGHNSDDPHDRGAAQLPDALRCATGTPRTRGVAPRAPGSAGGLERRHPAAHAGARCGTPAAAPAGTSTPTAATPPSGPASPGPTASGRASSSPRTTR